MYIVAYCHMESNCHDRDFLHGIIGVFDAFSEADECYGNHYRKCLDESGYQHCAVFEVRSDKVSFVEDWFGKRKARFGKTMWYMPTMTEDFFNESPMRQYKNWCKRVK